MAVNQELMDEIETKRGIIEGNPEEYDERRRTIISNLYTQREVFSWIQEHPDIKRKILSELGINSTGNLKKKMAKGARRLKDAWHYLNNAPELNKQGVPFIESLNSMQIIKIAKLVDPENNNGEYRTRNITLSLPGYSVPKPSEVKDLVEQCLHELREGDLYSVEKAAFIHLHLAAIQPFEGANKRVARLLQDRVLHDYRLPPAVIHPGERDIYMDVFREAAIAIQQKKD